MREQADVRTAGATPNNAQPINTNLQNIHKLYRIYEDTLKSKTKILSAILIKIFNYSKF